MEIVPNGFIYIMSNDLAPNCVKVGKTSNISRRISEHNRPSNVVGTWSMVWYRPVVNMNAAESSAHVCLVSFRVSGKKELFVIGLEEAERRVELAIRHWTLIEPKQKTPITKKITLDESKDNAQQTTLQNRTDDLFVRLWVSVLVGVGILTWYVFSPGSLFATVIISILLFSLA